jgi:hypothetical protein
MMFLCCPFCKSPARAQAAENATVVIDGNPVCHRPLCREQGIAYLQTLDKTEQLGIGFRPEQFELPLHIHGS